MGPAGTPDANEERQWAMFAHLGGVLAFFPVVHLLPALVIFLFYRKKGEYLRDQSREALNFNIVVLIASFVARIFGSLPLIPSLVWLVWLFALVFAVAGAVAASRGNRYRYPVTYRFLN